MYGYNTFHEELMQNLINSVHDGLSSHAYIFEGAKGLDLRGSARLFAAALTCPDRAIAPCGACQVCKETRADTNPDIVYVNSGDKKSIGAEQMRALEEDVAIKPFAAARKVYIIEDGAQLTEAAQNVFLKTFEEPPEYAVFIIIIENLAPLLETVLSRFTLIHFPRVSDARVKEYITGKYPEETDRLDFLVRYCAGIPGEADRIISDEYFETLRAESLEKLDALFSSDRISAFSVSEFAEQNKDRFNEILDFWISFSRDIILLQNGSEDKIINIDKKTELERFAARLDPGTVVKISEKTIKAQKMLARYVNIKAAAMWLAL